MCIFSLDTSGQTDPHKSCTKLHTHSSVQWECSTAPRPRQHVCYLSFLPADGWEGLICISYQSYWKLFLLPFQWMVKLISFAHISTRCWTFSYLFVDVLYSIRTVAPCLGWFLGEQTLRGRFACGDLLRGILGDHTSTLCFANAPPPLTNHRTLPQGCGQEALLGRDNPGDTLGASEAKG